MTRKKVKKLEIIVTIERKLGSELEGANNQDKLGIL